MTDYLLKESGLNVLTRTERPAHEFSKDTRKIEAQAYFRYCSENGLLTTSGGQSRLAMILKTFNHLNGTVNTSSDEAMREWLQGQTGSMLTHLYDLWLSYFDAHRTVPDDQGVTYEGLSVETGYRKFLYDFLGLAQNFYDTLPMADSVRRVLTKFFNDSVAVSDTFNILTNSALLFEDNVPFTGTVVLTQRKALADTLNLSDSFKLTMRKQVSDKVFTLDAFTLTDQQMHVFQDTLGVTDELSSLVMTKVFAGDAVSVLDSLKILQDKRITDSVALSDSMTLFTGAARVNFDNVEIEERILLLQIKKISDTISLSDEFFHGFAFFGGGHFGEYYNGY